MDKLKFVFKAKATADGKSNYIAITSIITKDDKTFLIPEELQQAVLHKEITNTKAYETIKNSIKKRHQTRSIWITMTDKLYKSYVDEDGNMMFQDEYLEEITQHQQISATINTNDPEDPIVKILEKLVENQQSNKRQSVKKLVERFVPEKFDGKSISAYQWMEIFEKECARFDITENEEKIESLRLFLEKSCLDWYSSMMIKLSGQSEWSEWKRNFVETYANKGWAASRYALSFKYQAGSLLEYAIKKEKLLLEIRKSMDQGTLIDIIAAGLPNFVADQINKEEILATRDLFNEIGRLEHLVRRKRDNEKKPNINMKQKPCKICEKLNKGTRFHPEPACWFRNKEEEAERKNTTRANIAVIDAELIDQNQKNE